MGYWERELRLRKYIDDHKLLTLDRDEAMPETYDPETMKFYCDCGEEIDMDMGMCDDCFQHLQRRITE